MGRNPLDLNRKLKKYKQYVKIIRRGLQVKFEVLTSKQPDFALGTYQVKGNTTYSLIVNVDIPRKSSGLLIDFWGLANNGNLQRLSQSKVNLVNRDARLKFHTFPKTRHLFMTFKIQQENDQPESLNYAINYIYIDSKNPIPRTNIGDVAIPNNLELKYNLECHPRVLQELELREPLKGFDLPINLDIFEHPLLVFLLKKETNPEYFETLKKNISFSNVPIDKNNNSSSFIPKVDIELIEDDLKEIQNKSNQLEVIMSKIDNLIHHKHSLENMLNQPEEGVSLEMEKHKNYLDILTQFQEGLNLKINYVNQLRVSNQESQLGENEKNNIDQVLDYYLQRINQDRNKIQLVVDETEQKWYIFQQKTLAPIDQKQNHDQNRLDKLLVHYRANQKKSLKMKEEIDQMIIKFMINWYQLIISQNYPKTEF